jgi:hypothetical protein
MATATLTKDETRKIIDGRGLVIVDLIDTIVFTDQATKMASKDLGYGEMLRKDVRKLSKREKGNIYDRSMNLYWHLMEPNKKMLERMNERSTGNDIIILSADLETVRLGVEDLLKHHKAQFDRLILRPQEQKYLSDEIWKADRVIEIAPKYSKIELYEDKLENIYHIQKTIDKSKIQSFLVTPAGFCEVYMTG